MGLWQTLVSASFPTLLTTADTMSVDREPGVLWFTPEKPEHISVGRQRIAERLEQRGYDVTVRGTTVRTLLTALRERGRYDVVIGTTRAGAIAGTLVSLITGQPFVVDHVDPIRQFETTHPRWLSLPVRWLEQLAFSVADHVLYVYAEEKSESVDSHPRIRLRTRISAWNTTDSRNPPLKAWMLPARGFPR